ncbi:MAG: DUF3570 domain-containing protein [Chitinophagales bacterium]
MFGNLKAQQQDSVFTSAIPSEQKPVQIDFMASYYTQDGEHSAVLGGEGQEDLKDYGGKIIIKIPLRNNKTLSFNNRISYFSSASTDDIDPSTISGASRNDLHVEVNAIIDKEVTTKRQFSYNIQLGAANEAHFASVNAGLGFSKSIDKWQAEIGVKSHFIMDTWGPYYNLSKLYPSDYFGPDDLKSNKRYSWQTAFFYNQIFNQRLQASLSVELIQQFGLLSTPFNRIYFSDMSLIDIERLPDYKLRLPISLKANYYASNWLIIRSSYRFYWDNFDLKAHTFALELPLKVHRFFSIYPFYRYHYQYGNQYFEAKGDHLSSETFYTSDYDLSDLQSHHMGGGVKWIPFRKTKKHLDSRVNIKAVEMRAAYYRRNDGFHSWIISGGVSMAILRNEEKVRFRDRF